MKITYKSYHSSFCDQTRIFSRQRFHFLIFNPIWNLVHPNLLFLDVFQKSQKELKDCDLVQPNLLCLDVFQKKQEELKDCNLVHTNLLFLDVFQKKQEELKNCNLVQTNLFTKFILSKCFSKKSRGIEGL